MAPCLQGQHRSFAQVGLTWRLDAPDSTAMLTPRRSLSSLASLQLTCLFGDFDAALLVPPWRLPRGPIAHGGIGLPRAGPTGRTRERPERLGLRLTSRRGTRCRRLRCSARWADESTLCQACAKNIKIMTLSAEIVCMLGALPMGRRSPQDPFLVTMSSGSVERGVGSRASDAAEGGAVNSQVVVLVRAVAEAALLLNV